jgi:hypothetical protein
MENSRRIRQLAARDVAPDAIAAQLDIRPATVRRVLGRSSKRGAPRKREASATLSFVTTPDVAERIRGAAAARGVAVSSIIDDLVQFALQKSEASAGTAARPSEAPPLDAISKPERRAKSPPGRAKSELVTAADAPESVRKLLKSYDPQELRWRVRNDRHEIVVTVLTRGNAEAKRWLWTVLSHGEVRELVRKYRGAGCAEPDRVLLRQQLKLTTTDIPIRPHLGFGAEG